MVNIEPRIMLEGMRANFLEVDELSKRVMAIVETAKQIHATTPAGTDITAQLSPHYKWLKTSGIISPNKWGNLPGGEVFTTPQASLSSTGSAATISARNTEISMPRP